MPEQLAGQILSVIGMILTVLSFQLKSKKQILMMQSAGSIFFLSSFILLESLSAVYLNVIFLIRNIIFYFRADQKWARHQIWLYVLLIAVTVAGLLGYKTLWDILPIIGSIFGTVAAYMDNENMFRILKLGDSPCWLIYNASVPSVGGLVCEAINIVSIILGLIRYRKDGFSKKETIKND